MEVVPCKRDNNGIYDVNTEDDGEGKGKLLTERVTEVWEQDTEVAEVIVVTEIVGEEYTTG